MNRYYLQYFLESYPTKKEFRMNICRYYILNAINNLYNRNKLIGLDFVEDIVRRFMQNDPFFNFQFTKLHRLFDKSYLVRIEGENDFVFLGFRNNSLFRSWISKSINADFIVHFNIDTFEVDYEQAVSS